MNFQPAKRKASRIVNLTPAFRASHGLPSGRRVPVPTCTQIFRLYFNGKSLSGYAWVHLPKTLLGKFCVHIEIYRRFTKGVPRLHGTQTFPCNGNEKSGYTLVSGRFYRGRGPCLDTLTHDVLLKRNSTKHASNLSVSLRTKSAHPRTPPRLSAPGVVPLWTISPRT